MLDTIMYSGGGMRNRNYRYNIAANTRLKYLSTNETDKMDQAKYYDNLFDLQ